MKYNSIENAERFIKEQIEWAKTNGYKNFIIWSNGKELIATLKTKDIANIFQRCELEERGFWKAIIFENGYRVEI
jgi:hypothetical protein